MQEFITTLFNGLSLSSIILLTSLGLAITFGLMRVINMAHGEFVMIGAYMTYVTQQLFSAFLPISMRDWYYIAALPLAFAATFLLGAVLEKLVISRAVRPRDRLAAGYLGHQPDPAAGGTFDLRRTGR